MLYTTLGRTNRKVSRIGFGGCPAGVKNYVETYDPGKTDDYGEGVRAARRAYELGINYFDTAPGYGNGLSEQIIGEALDGIPGENLFMATKVRYNEEPDVFKSLEGSLTRLRREHIDLLQLHGDYYTKELTDTLLQPGGMVEQMCRAKQEGLVQYLGFTGECQNAEFYRLISIPESLMSFRYSTMFCFSIRMIRFSNRAVCITVKKRGWALSQCAL